MTLPKIPNGGINLKKDEPTKFIKKTIFRPQQLRLRLNKLRSERMHEQLREGDLRNPFERDYGRLIHSPVFRRLQGKSQVFGAGTGDYYRTRLTHTLEVAQIARHLANKLKNHFINEIHPGLVINPLVVETAAIAHDIGHPPFGHKGEEVLNKLMFDKGLHFEGNAQNFRILMFLEQHKKTDGLDLTNAVLLAINKYPFIGVPSITPTKKLKGLYKTEWEYINEVRNKWNMPEGKRTLEAQLMDLSDDIAYSTHDIEDGIKAGKIYIDKTSLDEYLDDVVLELKGERYNKLFESIDIKSEVEKVLKEYLDRWNKILKECDYDLAATRRENTAFWVNQFVTNVGIIQDDDNWHKVTFVDENSENFILLRKLNILKKLAWVTMVKDLRVQRLQIRSEKIINNLWEVFQDESIGKTIIPQAWIKRYNSILKCTDQDWNWNRLVSDYISGMTDSYAEKIHSELFGIQSGSIFEIN